MLLHSIASFVCTDDHNQEIRISFQKWNDEFQRKRIAFRAVLQPGEPRKKDMIIEFNDCSQQVSID